MYQFAAALQTSTVKLTAFFKIFQKIVRVLRVNETKLPSRNVFIVHFFALESEKPSRNDERTLFWNSSRTLDLSLNPQPPNDAISQYPGLLQFQPFFGLYLWFLEEKTTSIRFCTKFYVKVSEFLQSKCTSLLLRSKPGQ